MPKVTYTVENAPGRIYGKNASELVFKEPESGAVNYSTSTTSGLLKSTKKQLYRGPPGEKDDGICIATIDEPTKGTLTVVHHTTTADPEEGSEGNTEGEDKSEDKSEHNTEHLKLKSTWFGSNNRTVTFKNVQYTWTGTTKITDKDGKIVAQMAKPWFFQGKLGDIEVDVADGEEGQEVLEMVLATYVQRWWEDKLKAEEAAKEAKEQKAKEKKAAQAAAKVQKLEKKKEDEEESKKKAAQEAQTA